MELRTTSSSYSLHVSFKPQKLFPRKPSKIKSNWPSVLRRRTKTSPYVGNPASSPGPYYPTSPEDKTIPAQSPFTLDKVAPYAFDDQSVASFYDYGPAVFEGIHSGDLRASDQRGISYSQKNEKADRNGRELLENPKTSSTEEITHSNGCEIEKVAQRKYDADTGNEGDRNIKYDETAELKQKQENTKQNNLAEKAMCEKISGAEKDSKNNFETIQPDTTFTHDNSVTDLLESSEKLQTTAILNGENTVNNTSPSFDALVKSETTRETHCQYGAVDTEACPDSQNFAQLRNNEAKQNYSNAETLDSDRNLQSVVSNSFSDNRGNISKKTTSWRCVTDATKKPSATATPVAWGDSARKSVETGLASAQSIGLLLVQTSSVCVTIPWATDWKHSPVNKIRRRCAILIMNPMFDWFITTVIFLNTIVMAMEYHGMNRNFENTLNNINLVSDPTDSQNLCSCFRKSKIENLRHFHAAVK